MPRVAGQDWKTVFRTRSLFGTDVMPSHPDSSWKLFSISSLVVLALAVNSVGCGWRSSKPLEASVDEAEKDADKSNDKSAAEKEKPATASKPAARTPGKPRSVEVLLDEIEIALADSGVTSQTDPNRDRTKRSAALRKQIAGGVEAATELIEQKPDDEAAIAKAWRSKLTLLYRGAIEDQDELADQLEAASEEVAGTQFTEEAEYGDALVIGTRYLGLKKPVHEVVARLTRHSKLFPDGKSSARLFLAYARKLALNDRQPDSHAVCQAALWELHGHPEQSHIRGFIRQMKEGQVRREETRKRDIVQKLIENQVAQIRGRLPLQIDELTILYDVKAEYRMVIYKYRVALDKADYKTEQQNIQTTISRKARSSSATRKLIDKGIRLKYEYYGKDGALYDSFIVQ